MDRFWKLDCYCTDIFIYDWIYWLLPHIYSTQKWHSVYHKWLEIVAISSTTCEYIHKHMTQLCISWVTPPTHVQSIHVNKYSHMYMHTWCSNNLQKLLGDGNSFHACGKLFQKLPFLPLSIPLKVKIKKLHFKSLPQRSSNMSMQDGTCTCTCTLISFEVWHVIQSLFDVILMPE